VRVGTYPVSGGYGAELPILTVRFPSDSIRQVRHLGQLLAIACPEAKFLSFSAARLSK
jgi:hypothetical protein